MTNELIFDVYVDALRDYNPQHPLLAEAVTIDPNSVEAEIFLDLIEEVLE